MVRILGSFSVLHQNNVSTKTSCRSLLHRNIQDSVNFTHSPAFVQQKFNFDYANFDLGSDPVAVAAREVLRMVNDNVVRPSPLEKINNLFNPASFCQGEATPGISAPSATEIIVRVFAEAYTPSSEKVKKFIKRVLSDQIRKDQIKEDQIRESPQNAEIIRNTLEKEVALRALGGSLDNPATYVPLKRCFEELFGKSSHKPR